MLHGQRPAHSAAEEDEDAGDDIEFRDINALTPPPSSHSHPSSSQGRRREFWEAGIHPSSSLSVGSAEAIGEAFSTMTREFGAMVVAGAAMQNNTNNSNSTAAVNGGHSNSANGNGGNFHDEPNLLGMGEEELEETNPLAIVPDSNPTPSPRRALTADAAAAANPSSVEDVPLHVVKMEEVESKISAWQTAEIAKINNRFKREEVIINGWEGEQAEKAAAWLKKVERKLEKQRARAMEKMQNDVAHTRRKAEEKRATAEAKRGTKVGKVLELAHLMRAMGRAPSKRSFF